MHEPSFKCIQDCATDQFQTPSDSDRQATPLAAFDMISVRFRIASPNDVLIAWYRILGCILLDQA